MGMESWERKNRIEPSVQYSTIMAVYHIYATSNTITHNRTIISVYIECSALWGESERVWIILNCCK